MTYAPIIIPTLCRDKHFIRLVESLKRNTWAKYTEIYVGLDYPPESKYREGYEKICKYLEGDFLEFAGFHVIKRTENYGSYRNSIELRELVMQKYDRFIRTDDDCEFSPNFIEYMNTCLERYEKDKNVLAVTGYSYPIRWKVSPGATVFKENFSCPMWGTGFWRDKYQELASYINEERLYTDVINIVKGGQIKRMMLRAKYEYVNHAIANVERSILLRRIIDISTRIYMAVNNKYVVVPVTSKVRNWGFDGSGEFCMNCVSRNRTINATNYSYYLQDIDADNSFDFVPDTENNILANRKLIDKFDTVPLIGRIKMYIKILCFRFKNNIW